jgi:glucosamine-6-phosphate deaminase
VSNSRFFGGDVTQVPKRAVTVGVGTVMVLIHCCVCVCGAPSCVDTVGGVLQDAKEVVIIITGVSKAIALQQVVEGAMSHQWTASAVQMHPNGIIVADEDATNELKV